MLAGAKDTQEYNEIMHKLREESYKHQAEEDDHDIEMKEKKKEISRIETEILMDYDPERKESLKKTLVVQE